MAYNVFGGTLKLAVSIYVKRSAALINISNSLSVDLLVWRSSICQESQSEDFISADTQECPGEESLECLYISPTTQCMFDVDGHHCGLMIPRGLIDGEFTRLYLMMMMCRDLNVHLKAG